MREGEAARTAHHGHALPEAIAAAAGRRHPGAIEFEIVRHDEVEAAVAVVVEERASAVPARRRGRQSRRSGRVAKRAVPLVVVEDALPVVGDEQVAIPVAVVVGGAGRLAPAGVREPGVDRHVLELETAEIAIEMSGGGAAGAFAVERGTVCDVDIGKAVVVGVEDRDAAAGGLEDVLLRIGAAGDVDGVEARRFREVAEVDGDRRQIGLDGFAAPDGRSAAAHPLEGIGGHPRQHHDERHCDRRGRQRSGDVLHAGCYPAASFGVLLRSRSSM